jgi:hypothetical protein
LATVEVARLAPTIVPATVIPAIAVASQRSFLRIVPASYYDAHSAWPTQVSAAAIVRQHGARDHKQRRNIQGKSVGGR